MITCTCPNCQVEIEFHAGLAGHAIPCPQCEEWVKVPGTQHPWRPPDATEQKWFEARILPEAEPTEAEALQLTPINTRAPEADAPAQPALPPIRCQCPFCNRILSVDSSAANQERTCPGCGGRLIVPPAEEAPPDPPAPKEEEVKPRPRRKRRRRRHGHDFDAAYHFALYQQDQFERGRTLALVIVMCLLLLTVVEVVGMLRLAPDSTKKVQPNETEYLVIYYSFAGLLIVVRLICMIGLLTAQSWARVVLGVLLTLGGMCGIFTIVRDNAVLGMIQIVLNLGFALVILGSPSLSAYTRD